MTLRVVLVAICVFLLSACDGSTTPPGGLPTITSARDIVLPLDAYGLTYRDRQLQMGADSRLTRACLAARGFAGYPIPDYSFLSELPAHPYGYYPIERDSAARDGFEAPFSVDAEVVAAQAVVDGWMTPGAKVALGEIVQVDGKMFPAEGSCSAVVNEQLRQVAGEAIDRLDWLENRRTEIFNAALLAPEVAERTTAWSDCMAERGYDYADPSLAISDPRWMGDGATDDERAAAVATVECNLSVGLTQLQVELTATGESRFLEDNRAAVEDVKRLRDAMRTELVALGR